MTTSGQQQTPAALHCTPHLLRGCDSGNRQHLVFASYLAAVFVSCEPFLCMTEFTICCLLCLLRSPPLKKQSIVLSSKRMDFPCLIARCNAPPADTKPAFYPADKMSMSTGNLDSTLLICMHTSIGLQFSHQYHCWLYREIFLSVAVSMATGRQV